jgi:hypothetical protein
MKGDDEKLARKFREMDDQIAELWRQFRQLSAKFSGQWNDISARDHSREAQLIEIKNMIELREERQC